MTPLLHPFLVNGRGGDPVVFVQCLFEKRALLIDLGDISALEPRKLLQVSDVLVSHTHVDHFYGFDRLLRVLVGRDQEVRLYGPEGFAERVGHRLAAYTWNLVDRYQTDLRFTVTEVRSADEGERTVFRMATGFRSEPEGGVVLDGGVLHRGPDFHIRCAVLDHRVPCLAFAVAERQHINVWKNRLAELGLGPGAWLRDLKRLVNEGAPDDTVVAVPEEGGERMLPLGLLREWALQIVPGQKIAYVTDAVHHEENARRIVDLVRGADVLFIEAVYAADDAELAADRYHLTSAQAGRLARLAGVRRLEPFHFSPRYHGDRERLQREVEAAFRAQG